jgi:4-hydroxybutyrate CoA-transferase
MNLKPISFVSPETAISHINSSQRVFVQGAAATPQILLRALVGQASRLRDVELIHLHTEGYAAYAQPEFHLSFKVANLFVGPILRPYLDYETVDYLPCFLSEIPQLFRSGRRPIDVALIHVSPPDKHGLCSLGTSVDVTRAAVEAANLVIAQVNSHMPRVHGDGMISLDQIDFFTECHFPLPVHKKSSIGPVEKKIGELVSTLIEDGTTLQVGIGAIPDAVMHSLGSHKNLGLHTETWSDGALELMRSGAIDNSRKIVYPGRTVSSFITGSQAVYDFINDNPSVVQLDVGYVNSPHVIARNPKVVAINSAVEVDLTGQVSADSIGARVISGVGGQMDFIRGASLSPGGKPVIALSSRTKSGHSRIVAKLKDGAGVVTTRAHVHYVVTEFGIADLYGKTLGERAKLLINLCHPDHREILAKQWRELHQLK